MRREGMRPGPQSEWRNPHAESVLMKAEEIEWPDQIDKAEKSERINEILNDLEVVDAIIDAGYPSDEETCDKIGEKHGLGAAEIAVLSRRLKEKTEKKAH